MQKPLILIVLVLASTCLGACTASEPRGVKFPSIAFCAKYKFASPWSYPKFLTIQSDGAGRVRYDWKDILDWYTVEDLPNATTYYVYPKTKKVLKSPINSYGTRFGTYYKDSLQEMYVTKPTEDSDIDGFKCTSCRVTSIQPNSGLIPAAAGSHATFEDNGHWFDKKTDLLVKQEEWHGEGKNRYIDRILLEKLELKEITKEVFDLPEGYVVKSN